jgi:hypothetical protein
VRIIAYRHIALDSDEPNGLYNLPPCNLAGHHGTGRRAVDTLPFHSCGAREGNTGSRPARTRCTRGGYLPGTADPAPDAADRMKRPPLARVADGSKWPEATPAREPGAPRWRGASQPRGRRASREPFPACRPVAGNRRPSRSAADEGRPAKSYFAGTPWRIRPFAGQPAERRRPNRRPPQRASFLTPRRPRGFVFLAGVRSGFAAG